MEVNTINSQKHVTSYLQQSEKFTKVDREIFQTKEQRETKTDSLKPIECAPEETGITEGVEATPKQVEKEVQSPVNQMAEQADKQRDMVENESHRDEEMQIGVKGQKGDLPEEGEYKRDTGQTDHCLEEVEESEEHVNLEGEDKEVSREGGGPNSQGS
ncbi:hypothetical protein HAX54_033703 [Datura stramonium]|uniref:Uncharacterized protein n=1 Tax=Datura stramonium TaxID=4076 RepID=A0ABS8VCS7_DATST|nr:hypothetical protein [Datura stramonium]